MGLNPSFVLLHSNLVLRVSLYNLIKFLNCSCYWLLNKQCSVNPLFLLCLPRVLTLHQDLFCNHNSLCPLFLTYYSSLCYTKRLFFKQTICHWGNHSLWLIRLLHKWHLLLRVMQWNIVGIFYITIISLMLMLLPHCNIILSTWNWRLMIGPRIPHTICTYLLHPCIFTTPLTLLIVVYFQVPLQEKPLFGVLTFCHKVFQASVS